MPDREVDERQAGVELRAEEGHSIGGQRRVRSHQAVQPVVQIGDFVGRHTFSQIRSGIESGTGGTGEHHLAGLVPGGHRDVGDRFAAVLAEPR